MKNEFKYKDWTYKLENGNHKVLSPKEKPKVVYKYYSNCKNSIDAITNHYLFCSHPYLLNDSMDCSPLLWDLSNMTKEFHASFYQRFNLNGVVEINFDEEKKNGFEQIKHIYFRIVSNNAGIISLTTEPLHTLMWSHYSSEKGFMIELDWSVVMNNLTKMNRKIKNYVFFPIQYVKKLEAIDFFYKDFESPDIPYLYSSAIKSHDWEYENEWRFMPYSTDYGVPNTLHSMFPDLPNKQERKVFYPLNAIQSITLGKNFFNEENVVKMVDASTYKMKLSKDLDFVNFMIENFMDRIYFCGEYENNKSFSRSAERITITKIDEFTIKVIRKNEGFYQIK